jgi:SPP1 gp7 family putative phage head morphogenesis protein
MSANTFLIDAATRHQVFVQRFAGGEANAAIDQLKRLENIVLGRLARETTQFQGSRLTIMLNDIRGIMDRFYLDFGNEVVQRTLDFSIGEAEFSTEMLNQVTQVQMQLPASSQLEQAVLREGMATPVGPSSVSIEDALSEFGTKKTSRVLNLVNDGVLLGDTNQQIIRNVAQEMETRQRRHAEALVRTITNHASSQAREAVYRENAGILEGYEWVATLDSRTTLICAGRDGRVYPVGGGPLPPAHWGCRSTTIPVVRDEFAIPGLKGDRPAKGADGAEQVSGASTYGGWLRKQPAEFQDEVLGETRGKLFRTGSLTIDKFRDETGRTYNLEQLRQLQPMAFQKANL